MTREERIEKLRHLITCMKCEVSGKCCDDNCSTQYAAGNMGEIIENLEEIAKALEQEPCGKDINVPATDAISKQAVLNILDDMVKDYIKENDFDKARGVAWVKVQKLPPVNPQPKTGYWIENAPEYQNIDPPYICSECGNMHLRKTDYCDQCGAKMESEGKECI